MKTVFVVPIEGAKVRDPATGKRIPETGALVTLSTFIRRRLKDGSLVERKPRDTETSQTDLLGSD